MNAEIFWLAKVSVSNLSLRSVDNIGGLFRAMFPDSKIAANFKLSCTSASYMIADGMSKYFTQLIVKDLMRQPVHKSTHKLLDQALPSKETSKSKRKLESEEKSQKKLKK